MTIVADRGRVPAVTVPVAEIVVLPLAGSGGQLLVGALNVPPSPGC